MFQLTVRYPIQERHAKNSDLFPAFCSVYIEIVPPQNLDSIHLLLLMTLIESRRAAACRLLLNEDLL
jgi:hypothetical protein